MTKRTHTGRAVHAARSPRPEAIRRARIAAGLTQTDAAALIFCSLRGWQDWESGARRLHPSMWRDWQNQIAKIGGRA